MQDTLIAYFDGEKYAGLFLAALGAAVIAAAVVMFRLRADLRSFAITVIVVALAEIALGVGLYLRTGPQVDRLAARLGSSPALFYADEGARMSRVQRNFVLVEYIELAVIIASAATAIVMKTRPGPSGIALGLLLSVSVLLAFDVIADRRGADYLAALVSGARHS